MKFKKIDNLVPNRNKVTERSLIMGKIITVCGDHGSGKTTVAANLGYMLA